VAESQISPVTARAGGYMAQSGPPILGIQLLMGDKTPIMIANVLAMFQEGVLEPIELFARAM
jgi:hypothetical protein